MERVMEVRSDGSRRGDVAYKMLIGAVTLLTATNCGSTPSDWLPEFEEPVASLTEVLRIDGYAEELVPIGAMAVRDDGTIAFIQPQDAEVRVFTADGAPSTTVGGGGGGPGELRFPTQLAWVADTLRVFDARTRRFTWFSPAFELQRTEQALPGTLGRTPDGALVLRTSDAAGALHLTRVDRDGADTAHVVPLPAGINGGAEIGEDVFISLPFANHARYVVAPDGEHIVVAMAHVLGDSAGTFDVTLAELDGDTLFHERYRFAAVPLTEKEARARIEERIEGERIPADYRAIVEAGFRRQTVIPAVFPPFRSVLLGNDGTVWIEHHPRDGRRPYYVIGGDGEPVGRLDLPEEAAGGAARRDRIWATVADSLGVQSVVVYDVVWDSG
ncbi:MAG: hypothetical protein WEA24_07750 [Gemmatimonadota bacterium]